MKQILRKIFSFFGAIVSSIVVHETVHIFQAGWKIQGVCFLGFREWMVGWILTESLHETLVIETVAIGIQFIYLLLIFYILYWKKE